MCTYCGTNNYRKIYENHYGPILKENNGRAYEVHHIDGNHSNNDPANLKLVTIQEHYNIHFEQGDYGACYWMSVQRMNKTPDEISKLASKLANQRITNGTWHFNSDNAKKWAKEKIENGTLYWLSKKHSEETSKKQKQLVKDGTHNLLGNKNPVHKRIKNETHHTLGPAHNLALLKSGKHASQKYQTCPHCSTIMDSANYAKHHGDNCHLVKQKVPLSLNPNYVNSQAKKWRIVDTITGDCQEVIGLNTWAKRNGYNRSTVTWSVKKFNQYKQYQISLLEIM
jgi:hypothetical protein